MSSTRPQATLLPGTPQDDRDIQPSPSRMQAEDGGATRTGAARSRQQENDFDEDVIDSLVHPTFVTNLQSVARDAPPSSAPQPPRPAPTKGPLSAGPTAPPRHRRRLNPYVVGSLSLWNLAHAQLFVEEEIRRWQLGMTPANLDVEQALGLLDSGNDGGNDMRFDPANVTGVSTITSQQQLLVPWNQPLMCDERPSRLQMIMEYCEWQWKIKAVLTSFFIIGYVQVLHGPTDNMLRVLHAELDRKDSELLEADQIAELGDLLRTLYIALLTNGTVVSTQISNSDKTLSSVVFVFSVFLCCGSFVWYLHKAQPLRVRIIWRLGTYWLELQRRYDTSKQDAELAPLIQHARSIMVTERAMWKCFPIAGKPGAKWRECEE